MKIAYFIHGRGRGHSSRALSLVPKLQSINWQCSIFAGGTAYEVLKGFERVSKIDSIVPGSPLLLFVKRILRDVSALKKMRPDILISDGDAPSTYAAKLLGIKVISIGHGLIFPYCKHDIKLPKKGWLQENIKVRIATICADFLVAVHFTPIKANRKNTFVVRPDMVLDSEITSCEDHLLTYFRDGNGRELVSELVRQGHAIRNFGDPIHIRGVINHKPDRETFQAQMSSALGVVGSAGSNLIFESMAMNKFMLLQYLESDFEQASNVRYVENSESGYGVISGQIDSNMVKEFSFRAKSGKKNQNNLGVIPALSDLIIEIIRSRI